MDERPQMLELIHGNKGFDVAEQWLEYGLRHGFRKVDATKRESCPDCGGSQSGSLGQYVYYSTLIKLKECGNCGLAWSDTLIDPDVIRRHFERSYKDEIYFRRDRRRIFQQIAALVDQHTPRGATVLDIGGAKGHLLAAVNARRPDLQLVLNDISRSACGYAASKFGLDAVCGGIDELKQLNARFNTVIMSDVLYYEPHLRRFWKLLPDLVADGGCVIIRAPNRLPLIRLFRDVHRLTKTPHERLLQRRIRFFNPEHIYVFTPAYLRSRLASLGFAETRVIPSELLAGEQSGSRQPFYFHVAKALAAVSCGKLIVTPGFLVLGKNLQPGDHAE
jgi:SAM-dependent methyltransferase